jgi:hypothetical protein
MMDDALLAALLRGDDPSREWWRVAGDERDLDRLVAAAEHHSVLPLAAARLVELPGAVPERVRLRFVELARQHAVVDLMREHELRQAIDALAAAGVMPIIFKGAHLANVCYDRPDLRPRLDADLLIRPDRSVRETAHDVLLSLGYTTPPHVGGDVVMAQRTYARRQGDLLRHAVDVHWRLSNPVAFADAVTWDDLEPDSRPIAALGPAARGPSIWHALAIACVHRIAHHAGSDCLIWLYDIDRIVRRMSDDDWDRWRSFVALSGIRRVSAASLRAASDVFRTPMPEWLTSLEQESSEPTSMFLGGPRLGMAAAVSDVRATAGLRSKLMLVREHLFPPGTYMRQVYAPASRAPLGWLYARRALAAARRWFISRT